MKPAFFTRARGYVTSSLRRLDEDQAGNVIVLYICAALLLVGMVWAIIGTGQRVVQKETIQTSADAAAFSAAVIKAKGMNIIAFCNLAMALLLAVIMLLRLIDGAITAALVVVTIGCAVPYTSAIFCSLVSPLESTRSEYHNLEQQIEPKIIDVMNGLGDLERAVQESFPALSLVEAYTVGTHSEYQQNFGKGQLVTITWPLPVGADLKLPAQDGTWNELCDHAAGMIGQLMATALDKVGIPAAASGAFGDAIHSLLSPLEGVLCPSDGSSSSSSTAQETAAGSATTCGGCENPQPPQQPASNIQMQTSSFTATRVNSDGSISTTPGTCTVTGAFPSSSCGDSSSGPSSSRLTCDDGNRYTNLTLISCAYKYTTNADLGGQVSGNKPKPLDITSDWKDHSQVRAFTLLTDTNMSARRAWAGIATKSPGSAPALNQLMGMAQAEFFAFNGHEDLWHMDWRARLVRFSFGDTSSTDEGGNSSGVPAGGASAISGALSSFLQNDATAGLADQFLLH